MNCPFVQSLLNIFTGLISLLEEYCRPQPFRFIEAVPQSQPYVEAKKWQSSN